MAQFNPPSELALLLQGITFPITTEELADYARDQGASEELLAQIAFTPNHIYRSVADIGLTLGLMDEFAGAENMWPDSMLDDDMQAPEESAIRIMDTDNDNEAITP